MHLGFPRVTSINNHNQTAQMGKRRREASALRIEWKGVEDHKQENELGRERKEERKEEARKEREKQEREWKGQLIRLILGGYGIVKSGVRVISEATQVASIDCRRVTRSDGVMLAKILPLEVWKHVCEDQQDNGLQDSISNCELAGHGGYSRTSLRWFLKSLKTATTSLLLAIGIT
jgi:hypothetical protein